MNRNVKSDIYFILLTFFLFNVLNFSLQAKPIVRVASQKIALNETLQFIIESNKEVRTLSFPNIKNFNRGSVSTSTNISVINNQITKVIRITQKFHPTKKGVFTIPAFNIKVGDENVPIKSFQVTVGDAKQRTTRRRRSLFDAFGGVFNDNAQPQEYIDIKADAFFAVTTNKKTIYRGEPFTITMAFYEAVSNKAPLNFPRDLGKQVGDISKKIKPSNCWEENSNISSVSPKLITLNNKNYRQSIIYQSTFFPLTDENIDIRQVGLNMIKYDVAKRRSFFGRNRKENYKTFYSKPIHINVKSLPEHPLKAIAPVGNYELREDVENGAKNAGKSFRYSFKIAGQGNISAIDNPQIFASNPVSFYSEGENTNITRESGQVYGSKSFDYFIEIDEPGQYALADYLYWIYFNFREEKYDTLISKKIIDVGGKKLKYTSTSENKASFDKERSKEELIYKANNILYHVQKSKFGTYIFNILLVLLTATLGYFFIRNKKS